MKLLLAVIPVLLLLRPPVAQAESAKNASAQGPQIVQLPGHPFGVIASHDGNALFVALTFAPAEASGIAVLQYDHAEYHLQRVVPVSGPTELALTHDGKVLIAAAGDSVFLLDTSRMVSGTGDPMIATFSDGTGAGSIYAAATPDDKHLFVSDEQAQSISVIDLARVLSKGYDSQALIGKIPVGLSPIALTFSPDARYLFTTSEQADPSWNFPTATMPGSTDPSAGTPDSQGALLVIDVSKAVTDPAHSVVAHVPAGLSPVRLTISPDGQRIYVTARGSNTLVVFDTAKLITDPDHATLASVPVGPAPVPLAIIQDGRTLVVGNSNRFGTADIRSQTLSVLDISKIGHGNPLIGAIGTGKFPREMCVSSDGQTLFLTNFLSNSLEIINTRNLPMTPGQSGTAPKIDTP
jgi:YVTN family beta-propeller protein